ncbi:MAG: hypothetical protein NVS3B3_23770 [Aquirhabdus sp.]
MVSPAAIIHFWFCALRFFKGAKDEVEINAAPTCGSRKHSGQGGMAAQTEDATGGTQPP